MRCKHEDDDGDDQDVLRPLRRLEESPRVLGWIYGWKDLKPSVEELKTWKSRVGALGFVFNHVSASDVMVGPAGGLARDVTDGQGLHDHPDGLFPEGSDQDGEVVPRVNDGVKFAVNLTSRRSCSQQLLNGHRVHES